ncbi:MAG: glycoside hydrolase family 32 protein [Armatimonadota bacterium]|nr:glycoside hydrolase family 32 protein [Armatimonadota bacterium]
MSQLQNKLYTEHRPGYHFLPPAGWMNDPNGLIHFRGEYHLFYQHNPESAVPRNIVWGHAVSKDLVHWKHLPIALRPDKPYDKDGVWTGCMVDDEGTPTAVYTGVHPEVQCIATSKDMLTWQKAPENPVIASPPPGLQVTGFRDPYVWRNREWWYAVVGSGIRDVGGAILLYRSRDLRRWEYLEPALVGEKAKTGEMWECPNLFPLGRKWVLWTSPLPLGRVIYFVGAFRNGRLTPEYQGEMDLGGCFYAPQCFRDARGRRILFGWLWENRPEKMSVEAGWAGVQSLPRQVSLSPDGRLLFEPVAELRQLRRERASLPAQTLRSGEEVALKSLTGDRWELRVEIQPQEAQQCGMRLVHTADEGQVTTIAFSQAEGKLSIDRTRSSRYEEVARDIRSAPFSLKDGEILRLHVFVDRSVLEVYANGHTCLTSRIYPQGTGGYQPYLFAEGGSAQLTRIEGWTLEAVW